MKLPTLYVKEVNDETAANFRYFDELQTIAREQLAHPLIVESLGTAVVSRYVEVLDKLTPANMNGNRASLARKLAAAGKIATVLMPDWGKVQFDPSIYNGPKPQKIHKRNKRQAVVRAIEDFEFKHSGLVVWKETTTDEQSFRANPVLILDNQLVPAAKPTVLVHELTHIVQCQDNPVGPANYFTSSDSWMREELESYEKQATIANARIKAGLNEEGEALVSVDARLINYVRRKLKPSEDDPYRPTLRLLRELGNRGLEL